MILENKRSVLQKYSGSQKLSQIGKPRLFRGRFQYSNFRNKFVIVFYSCVRVVKRSKASCSSFPCDGDVRLRSGPWLFVADFSV
ncbi:hypothetical protein LEP1GSC188_3577 [Leptospira weilii serovar Topaz str. LT2116]|uniref:Uncharacterized protein n=1 Tax=Leptospira weilii serovar Topaz str. LT2116 TaxID=1088540 RepID=M3GVV1_9LEPT|nr:hypothetical protein LEP1GSC188_3577 [Leptospira weilii serovar Topaz str. LT2116]